jgi:hypothetical protein
MIPPRQRRSLPSLSCIGLITRAADCSELMQMKVESPVTSPDYFFVDPLSLEIPQP